MQFYVVTIEDENSVRWQSFINQPVFANISNNLLKFGIRGSSLDVSDYFKLAVSGKSKPLTPGELGCTLSHLKALDNFVKSNQEYALIFEDDAIEVNYIDLSNFEQEIINLKLNENFLFSLGGIQMKICNRVRGYELKDNIYGKKVLKIDHDFLDRFAYAYAYIVDRKMAELLLNYHISPQVYDDWSRLTDFNESFNFYATHLFDHPVINDLECNSYLESERKLVNQKNNSKFDFVKYLRVKLKSILLDKFILY